MKAVHNVVSASVTLTERHNEVDIPNIVTNQSPVLTRRNPRLSLTHVHLNTSPLSHDTHVIPEFLQIPQLAINHVPSGGLGAILNITLPGLIIFE